MDSVLLSFMLALVIFTAWQLVLRRRAERASRLAAKQARLLMETSLSVEQRDYAVAIKDSGLSLLTVINDIFDFSKIDAGKLDLENIDFHFLDLINHALNGLRFSAASKRIEIRTELSSTLPKWLKGDPGRIRQILNNLISNAIKFTEYGIEVLKNGRSPMNRCEHHA